MFEKAKQFFIKSCNILIFKEETLRLNCADFESMDFYDSSGNSFVYVCRFKRKVSVVDVIRYKKFDVLTWEPKINDTKFLLHLIEMNPLLNYEVLASYFKVSHN